VVCRLKVPKEQLQTKESRNEDSDCARQIEKEAVEEDPHKASAKGDNENKKNNTLDTSKYYIVGIYTSLHILTNT
jgi:hypothetical protein